MKKSNTIPNKKIKTFIKKIIPGQYYIKTSCLSAGKLIVANPFKEWENPYNKFVNILKMMRI